MEEAKSSLVNISKIGEEIQSLMNKYRDQRTEINRESLDKKTKASREIYENLKMHSPTGYGPSDLLRIVERAEKLLDPSRPSPTPSPFRTTPRKLSSFSFSSVQPISPIVGSKSLETLPKISPSSLSKTVTKSPHQSTQDFLPRHFAPLIKSKTSEEHKQHTPPARVRKSKSNDWQEKPNTFSFQQLVRDFTPSPENNSPRLQDFIEKNQTKSPPPIHKNSLSTTDPTLTNTNIPLVTEEGEREESPPEVKMEETSTPRANSHSPLAIIITNSSTPIIPTNTLEEENNELPYLQPVLTSSTPKKKRFWWFMAAIMALTLVLISIGLMAASAGTSIPERLKFLQDGADFLNNASYGAYIFSSLGVVITICAFLIISGCSLRKQPNSYQPIPLQEHKNLRSESPTHLRTLETLRKSPHPNPPPPEQLTTTSLSNTENRNLKASLPATTPNLNIHPRTTNDEAEVGMALK